jgi:hypothetical protein
VHLAGLRASKSRRGRPRLERAVGVDDRRAVAVVLALDDLVGDGCTGKRKAGPRVGHRQARPPDKVLDLGRAVAPEVAPRERRSLSERERAHVHFLRWLYQTDHLDP